MSLIRNVMGRKKNIPHDEHHMDLDSDDPRTLRYNVMKFEKALGIEIRKGLKGKTMAKDD